MPPWIDALGALPARHANQCNVPRSMGRQKWYRLSATLPASVVLGGEPTGGEPVEDVLQLELYDNLGAFAATTVHAGTFELAGADAALASCGVCVRALAAKGTAAEEEYFATAGTVEVTEVGGDGAPISAALRDLVFVQLDPATKQPLTDGCAAALAGVQISGTIVAVGGGGSGGGAGSNSCPTILGD